MGQALYRKYRSKKLDEIVGQRPVTTALKNALKSGNISHAYLFTGPRGVGKTSIARILAFEINQIPYDSDELPLDIIEIDAASNRRIDEIRDLREKVRIAPVSAKYKVYIIDEVHMLTREAFNALLKTLEEPPDHVIFILATTEAHKLPETIVSRTQRYAFKLATTQEVSDHLKAVAKQESVDINEEALMLLAQHSGGSLRDALSLLDQVRHSAKKIDASVVRLNLGLPSSDIVESLFSAIQTTEPQAIITVLEQARNDGASATLIAEQLLQTLRNNLSSKNSTLSIDETLQLAQALLQVEASARPDIQLEIALIGAQLSRHNTGVRLVNAPARMQTDQPPLTISEPAVRHAKKPAAAPEQPIANTLASAAETVAEPTPAYVTVPSGETQDMSPEVWATAIDKIRQTHNTIYSILRMAQPNFDNLAEHQVTLLFKFPFHQKRINEARNKQVIIDTLAGLGVSGYELICDVLPKEKHEEVSEAAPESFNHQTPPEQDNALLNQIRSVFGGAEVLE